MESSSCPIRIPKRRCRYGDRHILVPLRFPTNPSSPEAGRFRERSSPLILLVNKQNGQGFPWPSIHMVAGGGFTAVLRRAFCSGELAARHRNSRTSPRGFAARRV